MPVCGIFQLFNAILVDACFKGFSDIFDLQRRLVFAAHFKPSHFGVVAAFLRGEITVFELFHRAFVHAENRCVATVAIVFKRTFSVKRILS